ncbi:MAG: cytochrome c biogenesis protein CcsA, partial [Ilumatobacteraceae bacterium]
MLAASLNGLIGHAVLVIGLVASLFGAMSLAYGTVVADRRILRTAPNYAWLAAATAVAAFAVMMHALLTYDFSLAYVQQVGSRSTPLLFNITAIWSALEGSILLWLMVLAGYTAIIMRRYRKRLDDPLIAWALVTMFAVTAFFFFLAFGPTDVFAAGAPGVTDGPGPNPLLQNHILVMFHPPILYLGYVGFTVPFAFAIGALATGRVGEGWLLETRRWALFAWGFLGVGIILGGWWSYEVLGWSGVWAWDP